MISRIVRQLYLSLLVFPLLAGQAVAEPVNWDWELRCCLTQDQIRNVFLVTLTGANRPVAQLQLITPKKQLAGYDPSTQGFYPPTHELLYASGPVTMPIDDADWDKHRPRRLVLSRVYPGKYWVKVVGLRNGEYHLQFQPGGIAQAGPGSRNSLVDQAFYNVAIKAGETHTYTFNGQYSDIYDGSIPRTDPGRFRVKRAK